MRIPERWHVGPQAYPGIIAIPEAAGIDRRFHRIPPTHRRTGANSCKDGFWNAFWIGFGKLFLPLPPWLLSRVATGVDCNTSGSRGGRVVLRRSAEPRGSARPDGGAAQVAAGLQRGDRGAHQLLGICVLGLAPRVGLGFAVTRTPRACCERWKLGSPRRTLWRQAGNSRACSSQSPGCRAAWAFSCLARPSAPSFLPATRRTSRVPAALALVATAIAGPLVAVVGRIAAIRFMQWLGILLRQVVSRRWHIAWSRGGGESRSQAPSFRSCPRCCCGFSRGAGRCSRCSARGPNRPHDQRAFAEAITALFLIVLGSTGLLLLLAFLPRGPCALSGPEPRCCCSLPPPGSSCRDHVIMRRIARNVPGLTAFAIIVFALVVAFVGEESLGTERLTLSPAPAAPVPDAGSSAPGPAPNAPGMPHNAHGGGLRAAAFTAQVLAGADDASCGRFGEQVAAYSGVSGGSLGIATYLVARQRSTSPWAAGRNAPPAFH